MYLEGKMQMAHDTHPTLCLIYTETVIVKFGVKENNVVHVAGFCLIY